MTWSLRLENGDLVRGSGNSLDTIMGQDKVIQDLFCWIKEPYGTDPLNPELGSFIEIGDESSGVLIDGTVSYFSNDYAEMVVSEIRRIINAYRTKQMARLRVELQQYNGLYTFTDSEIVERYNVFYESNYDILYVTVDLEMVNGDFYRLNVPVSAPTTQGVSS